MLYAKIFQTNVINHSNELSRVKEFEGQLLKLDPNQLIVSFHNGKSATYRLEFLEEDFLSKTYLGKFDNDVKFRLIYPSDFTLNNLKTKYNCVSAFSIGSLNPDGYAIHFLLFESIVDCKLEIVEKDIAEQIEMLILVALMELKAGQHQFFLEYSKRILGLINDSSELLDLEKGEELLGIMRQNVNLYNSENKKKIIGLPKST
jgi:hypothetical protein